MSLAIKYRPNNLNEIVGNESAVKALKSILARPKEQIQHSLMFTGPSGCGKTTLARIVKDALGCGDQDYYEVDAAEFRGIDTVRDIRRNMMYKPMNGSCRVWLLDECHQLSKDAQNGLLKALEDTPNHVYFLLATTDPEKLLPTIRGRCAQFEVQPLEEDEIISLLRDISGAERKRVPLEVLKQIARDSMGSCRNAIQILDTVVDLPPDEMKEAAAKTATNESATIELCWALIKREPWSKVANIINGLKKEDPEKVRRAVMGYCEKVMDTEKNAPQASIVITEFEDAPVFSGGWASLKNRAYQILLS